MRIVDLAEAVAPGCRIDAVGIRPGEKLHEMMITAEDARKATEYDDHYVIHPAFPWWGEDLAYETGHPVPDGFTYASNTNDRWLTVEELRDLLGEEPPAVRLRPRAAAERDAASL